MAIIAAELGHGFDLPVLPVQVKTLTRTDYVWSKHQLPTNVCFAAQPASFKFNALHDKLLTMIIGVLPTEVKTPFGRSGNAELSRFLLTEIGLFENKLAKLRRCVRRVHFAKALNRENRPPPPPPLRYAMFTRGLLCWLFWPTMTKNNK